MPEYLYVHKPEKGVWGGDLAQIYIKGASYSVDFAAVRPISKPKTKPCRTPVHIAVVMLDALVCKVTSFPTVLA